MKYKSIAAALVALAIAGCDTVPGGGAGGAPLGAGDASNPDTLAYFQQTIGDRVLFPVDQSTLTPEAQATLDLQAAWLLDRPSINVLVEGHADEQGTREYNLALGARRAASVQAYLVSKGLTDNRVRTITYGKERPLEVCSTESCWAKNRRAVTVVEGGFGS
ncbi:MAG: peptidoglycan-associated lipoprotein Pal [Pseudomonadota bacterium]